jgi:hypothetical protein
MNFVDESNIPKSYICPISKDIMKDPVSTCDGYTYERTEIEKWLSQNNTSPLTNETLDNKKLITNYTLKGAINEFIVANKKINLVTDSSVKLSSENVNNNSKDIYLLLDVSTSMKERHKVEGDTFITTMGIAKHSAKTIVKMLSSSDRLCIITFSDIITLKMDLMNMNEDNQIKALAIIENIFPSGSTNIWGSLAKALYMIKNRKNKDNFSCICLLTDGQANVSPPRGELYEMNRFYTNENELNCVLNTYAFGSHPDRFLLKSLSDVTNGLFSNIPSADMVGTTFINTIASLLCMSNEDYNKRKLKQSNTNIKVQLYTLLYDIVNNLKNNYISREENLKKYYDIVLEFINNIKNKKEYSSTDFYTNIVHDLEDQVLKGLSKPNWYTKWGEGYILMLANAHQYEICNNFKDHSVQGYSNDEFIKIRDYGEKLFKTISPPKAITNNSSQNHYRGRGVGGNTIQTQLVNTQTLLNRTGGCILQGSKICMKNKKWKNIEHIRKGDIILNNNNKEMKVICVTKQMCKNTKFVKLGDFYITPYHPIKINIKKKLTWVFPLNISNEYSIFNEPYYMYNLYVGEGGHMIVNNYITATLGHKLNDNDIINNNFWGNGIIDDLKNFDGWNNGIIELYDYNFIRNDNNDVISLKNI